MLPAIPRLILLVVLGCTFVYFLGAGGRTFTRSGADDSGAAFAQLSFVWSGAATTIILGLYVPIRIYSGIGSLAVLLCSLTLYEWARHTIWGRSFYVAWSGNTLRTCRAERRARVDIRRLRRRVRSIQETHRDVPTADRQASVA